MEMIEDEGLDKADIVFITDGDCAVSQNFLREFNAWKEARQVTVVAVVINAGGWGCSTATVEQFADQVEKVTDFTADAAEAQVFAHL